MSDYTKTTNFTAKDSLETGNADKLIKGSLFDTEFDAIATAIATKYDINDLASEAQAQAGTSNVVLMTPLRVQDWGAQNTCLKDASALTTGDLADDRLSANVPLINAANEFTAAQTIKSASPQLKFEETDGAADNTIWDFSIQGEAFRGRILNDDEDTAVNWLNITRTGTTTDLIAFTATSATVNSKTIYTETTVAALTAIDVSGLVATDGILIDDGGAGKRMAFQDMGLRFVSADADQTFALGDANTAQAVGATARTYTIPANATVAFPVGVIIGLVSTGAGTITIDPAASVTINSIIEQAGTTNRTVLAGGMAILYKVGTNAWNLTGDIS